MNDKDTNEIVKAIVLLTDTTASEVEKLNDRINKLERQLQKQHAAHQDVLQVYRIADEQLTCQAKWILLASHCLAQMVSLHNVEMNMGERQDIEDEMVQTASDLCKACKDMIEKGEAALADAKKYASEQN